MARTAVFSEDGEPDDSTPFDTTGIPRTSVRRDGDASPSPAASFGSDKENRLTPQQPGKRRTMGPPELPTPEQSASRASLKRKAGSRDAPMSATQALHQRNLDRVSEKDFYDPGQSIDERRVLRKRYRDLSRELTGMRFSYVLEFNALLTTTHKILAPSISPQALMALSKLSIALMSCTTLSSRRLMLLLTRDSWCPPQTCP